jgi:hypothetical protein
MLMMMITVVVVVVVMVMVMVMVIVMVMMMMLMMMPMMVIVMAAAAAVVKLIYLLGRGLKCICSPMKNNRKTTFMQYCGTRGETAGCKFNVTASRMRMRSSSPPLATTV